MNVKVVAISDTHCQLEKVKIPDGDIFIHAGDLTYRGKTTEIDLELEKMQKLPHEHKVIIAGNHDWLFEINNDTARKLCEDRGIIYLQDSMIKLEELKIYGSPWQPEFCDWAFNLDSAGLKEKWALVPNDLDILVTHGPPYLILDETPMRQHVGCIHLMKRIEEVKPKIHIFGHIHDDYGIKKFSETTHINASTCDERYKPINKPIVIEFKDGQVEDIRNE